ncbi:MAG TPA: type II 3-dehydroquinate dehydratase [Acidimicrobiia bacterium]|nr:type II 3-dehydroquinate dehydratase [Acidimicrobiia bacterium]
MVEERTTASRVSRLAVSERISMPRLLLLSGPNLNLFGQRDPAVYGTDTLDDFVGDARTTASEHGYDLEHVQSNHEGDIVDAIHDARGRCDALVINPGAFAHYSYAIADALQTFDGVKIELHVSNTAAREAWRHHSVISASVTGTITGLGRVGYRLAIEAAVAKLGDR